MNPRKENHVPVEAGAEVALKSTFGNLRKYTGKRNGIFTDAFDWLEDKRKDDDVGDLWRVHDKLYDLEKFVYKHPGGADFIYNSRGTDITEAFEASHIVNFEKTEKILAKYYVKDATTPRNSPYTLKPNGFYKTLKRRAEPILKEIGTEPTVEVKIGQDLLAASFVALSFVGVWSESFLVLILAGIVLDFCLSCAHNFAHGRDSWRKYYIDLSLMSSFEWRITHGLSHHMYPNTLLDWEVLAFEPMLMFLPVKSKNLIQSHAVLVYQHIVYFSGFGIGWMSRLVNMLIGRREFRWETLTPLIEFALWNLVSSSLWWSIYAWFIIHGTCSYFFMLIGFIAGHHHPVSLHDGDEVREDPDFGLCQLDATLEKKEKTLNSTLWITLVSFGDHPLHHLFPAVCHSKLEPLRQVVASTLREFQQEWIHLPQWELLVGINQQYMRTESNQQIVKDLKRTLRT